MKAEEDHGYVFEIQSLVAHSVSVRVACGPKSMKAYAHVEVAVPLDDNDIPAWVKNDIMPKIRKELGVAALAEHDKLEGDIAEAVLQLMARGETQV